MQSLRLYDVGSSVLRLEAPSEAALLDCCFQNESVAFTAGSDGSIARFSILNCLTLSKDLGFRSVFILILDAFFVYRNGLVAYMFLQLLKPSLGLIWGETKKEI